MIMKREKRHDEVVEEVMRKLEKNNLYVKCKWKVKEVKLLEIVIELEGIRIKEEKIKMVLG